MFFWGVYMKPRGVCFHSDHVYMNDWFKEIDDGRTRWLRCETHIHKEAEDFEAQVQEHHDRVEDYRHGVPQ